MTALLRMSTGLGIAKQPDGKTIVVGNFTTVNGATRTNLARLTSGTAALQTLATSGDGTTATWERSGSAPESNRSPLSIPWMAQPTRFSEMPEIDC